MVVKKFTTGLKIPMLDGADEGYGLDASMRGSFALRLEWEPNKTRVTELTQAPSFPGINEFTYMYTSFQPQKNSRGLFHSI